MPSWCFSFWFSRWSFCFLWHLCVQYHSTYLHFFISFLCWGGCCYWRMSTTLHHHLDLYQSAESNDIKRNVQCICGCQSVDEVLKYHETARAIMRNAHFNFHSWASNCIKLPTRAKADSTLDTDTSVIILGLKWSTYTDTLALSKSHVTTFLS